MEKFYYFSKDKINFVLGGGFNKLSFIKLIENQ